MATTYDPQLLLGEQLAGLTCQTAQTRLTVSPASYASYLPVLLGFGGGVSILRGGGLAAAVEEHGSSARCRSYVLLR